VSHAACGTDTVENSAVETQHVPVDMAAGPDGSVPEPVDLSEFEVLLTHFGDEYTSVRRTEIDGDDARDLEGRCSLCSND
jgi:hypothetical protein